VHVWGRVCEVEALTEIARRYNVKLLFDAAHAFGCSYKGKMIGGFGDAEIFSFHATKFLNTFEGGAVVTDNDELASRIRLMKNFGFSGYDQVIYIGTNGKMTEVSAAMGLTNLESMHDFIAVNRRNYEQYQEELADLEGVTLLAYEEEERCNYQYVVAEIDERRTGVSRDQLMEVLHAENVLARRYFYPGCHRMEPYRSDYPEAGKQLPETEKVTERVLCLPTGTAVNAAAVTAICRIICLVLNNGAVISRKLNT